MTSVRPRLLAAVPILGLALLLGATPAPASLPDSCNGSVDVALGAPKADVGTESDAGTVTLVFGPSGSGFGNPADITIDESDLTGTPPTAGDRFGASVVWGFENADPHCSMLAIGAPGADNGAGRVYVFVVDEDGIVPSSISVLTQDSPGVADTAEAGDGFGSSLYFGGELFVSWLAVGSPNEDIGTVADAGMIHVLPYPAWGTGSVSYRQGSGPVPDRSEAGDHFGAAIGPGRNVWSLWIGVPEEDIGSLVDAGSVIVLSGSGNDTTVNLPGTVGSTRVLTQNSSGVPDVAEAHDHFGAVLSALPGTQNVDRAPIVGVPGENVGKIRDAGIVQVTYQDGSWATFRQGVGGVNGTAEAWDRFGASISVAVDVVLIGVPGESLGSATSAGVIHRMTAAGAIPKLSGAREESVSQGTTGVPGTSQAGDLWGAAVAFSVSGAVVGAPGEDGSAVDAGSVTFVPWNPTTMKTLDPAHSTAYFLGDANFPGAQQAGAGFGATAYSIAQ